MTVVIIAQVFCRTFLGFSIYWAEELARYLLVWITFLGASMAFRNADLASFDLVQKKINPEWQWIYRLFIEASVLFFVAVAFYYGIKQTFSPSIMNQVSPALRLPMSVNYMAVPAGFGLMLIYGLSSIITLFLNQRKKEEVESYQVGVAKEAK